METTKGCACEGGLIEYRWRTADVREMWCADCRGLILVQNFARAGSVITPEGTCAYCGKPCKRGTECRRCAIERWEVTR